MTRIQIQGVVASTRPMAAYSGVKFSEATVRSLAEAIKNGELAVGLHHDPRIHIDAQVVDAFVETDEDGHVKALATYEVDETEWRSKGGDSAFGFSPTMRQHFLGNRDDPMIVIGGDAHWFTDEMIQAGFAELAETGVTVQAVRLYQFSDLPPALVLLVLQQLSAIPTGVLSAYIYDTLKHFLRKEPSKFHLTITDDKTGTTSHAYLETSSPDQLKHAIDTLPAALRGGRDYDYSSEADAWKTR